MTQRYTQFHTVPSQPCPAICQRKQGGESWPFPSALTRTPAKQDPEPTEALTYSFCCLLEFWVPNLGSTRARQPLLLTMSGALRWPAQCERTSKGKGRGAYSPSAALAPVIKTTQLPRGGAPPSHLASSPIWSNRAGWPAGWLAGRHGRKWPAGRRQARDPHACLGERHFKWAWTRGPVSCREV